MTLSMFDRSNRASNPVWPSARQQLAHSVAVRATAIAIVVVTTLCSVDLTAVIAQTSAKQATQEFVSQALQILQDKQKSVQQKRRDLKPLMEARFDATEMARSTLGYHWRSLTPEQRADFTRTFTAFIEAAYLDKVQDYSGQAVHFGQSRSIGQGYEEVDTTIVQAGQNPIPVTYLLQQTQNGWKVYDVTVDNISIIANYRNQFNRVINEQGFPKLMADLRAKEQQLGSELGQG